jgi:hypothetical protein
MMTPPDHIHAAMQIMNEMAKSARDEHEEFLRVIAQERAVKEELIEQLGYVLQEAFATVAKQDRVRLCTQRDSRGIRHLEFVTIASSHRDAQYAWVEVPADDSRFDIVSVDEVVANKWPIEQVFARAHQILLGSYDGLRLERVIEVRAVTAVLKGVSGAWKRGGLSV